MQAVMPVSNRRKESGTIPPVNKFAGSPCTYVLWKITCAILLFLLVIGIFAL